MIGMLNENGDSSRSRKPRVSRACSAHDDSCFADDFFYDSDIKQCNIWVYVSREPVSRVAACWNPMKKFARKAEENASWVKQCFFCSALSKDFILRHGCSNVSETIADYANFQDEDVKDIFNSATYMLASDHCRGTRRCRKFNCAVPGAPLEDETMLAKFITSSALQVSDAKNLTLREKQEGNQLCRLKEFYKGCNCGPVTKNPEASLSLAKNRLRQFDVVVPVEHLFEGMKFLTYVMNLPIPKEIESVRTIRSVCEKYVSNFTAEFEAAAWTAFEKRGDIDVIDIDCTGKAWSCYFARNAITKKMHEQGNLIGSIEAASGHSEHVTKRIQEQNSLDHEVHRFSKELWNEQLAQLKNLEGEPACEIECGAAEVMSTCIETVADLEKEHGILFDSDEFRSIAGAQRFRCSFVPKRSDENSDIRGPLSSPSKQYFCYDEG